MYGDLPLLIQVVMSQHVITLGQGGGKRKLYSVDPRPDMGGLNDKWKLC